MIEGQRSYIMEENNLHWFAVYTKPRWEKKVAAILEGKGIENYCPLNKVVKQWSDRKKIVLEPIFKSYVFVRVPDAAKWELRSINVIILYTGGFAQPVNKIDDAVNASQFPFFSFRHPYKYIGFENGLHHNFFPVAPLFYHPV